MADSPALRALSHRGFGLFFAAVVVATTGGFMQSLAVPAYMNDLTDSNTWVAAAAFAVLVPSMLTTPVAGIWSDRISRKAILLASFGVQLAASSAFLVLFSADALTPWLIIALQIVVGVASGFQWAPTQATPSLLVPQEDLISAVRLVSLSFTAGRALGPALAGITLAKWGPGPAFVVTMIGFGTALVLLAFVTLHPVPKVAPEPFWTQFREGLSYIAQRPAIRLVVVASFVVASTGALFAFALVESVADDVFGLDDGGLAWLTATFGFGSLLSGLYITRYGDRHARSRLEFLAMGVYAGGVLLSGATSLLFVGLLGYAVFGMAHMVHGVTVNSALQVQVDEVHRGRVMSVWLMSVLTGLPVGAFIGGFLGDLVSMRFVMLLYGSLLGAFWLYASARSNRFAQLDLGHA